MKNVFNKGVIKNQTFVMIGGKMNGFQQDQNQPFPIIITAI